MELSRIEARGLAFIPLPDPDIGCRLSQGGDMTCIKRLSPGEDNFRRELYCELSVTKSSGADRMIAQSQAGSLLSTLQCPQQKSHK